tara:strand:+ start:1047 stop:1370 length:324 start_codon:yes stop_codon:yes gene_type:complete
MADRYDVATAILAINPKAQVTIHDENLDTIEWNKGTTPISKADIQAKQAELKTAYEGKAYARKRAEEYPSVKDFMEAYTEKEIGGSSTKWDAYKTAYNKVRTDNPKS